MKNAWIQLRRHWLYNLITLFISLAIGAGIFLLYFFLRNRAFIDAVNGMTIGAMVVSLSGVLAWLSFLGAFDTFAFGFKQLGSMLFAKDARRDGSYSDYRDSKREKRNNSTYNFIAIIAAGLILLIAVLVLEIIYHTKF